MNKYSIVLSEDYCFLKNHIIVTNLVEKGSSNFKIKSYQKDIREMVLITDKEVRLGLYEIKYKNKTLKWKVVKEDLDNQSACNGDKVRLSGESSISFTAWGTDKEICPVDIKTGKIIHPERLNSFIEKNMGLKDFKIINIKTYPKTALSDNKVVIYNRIFLEVEGIVSDEKTTNQLYFQNIGKMKSYGLGAIKVLKV